MNIQPLKIRKCTIITHQIVPYHQQIILSLSSTQQIKYDYSQYCQRVSQTIWVINIPFQIQLDKHCQSSLDFILLLQTQSQYQLFGQCKINYHALHLHSQKQIKLLITHECYQVIGQMFISIIYQTQQKKQTGYSFTIKLMILNFLLKNQYQQKFNLSILQNENPIVTFQNISSLKVKRKFKDVFNISCVQRSSIFNWILKSHQNNQYLAEGQLLINNLTQGGNQKGTIKMQNQQGKRVATIELIYFMKKVENHHKTNLKLIHNQIFSKRKQLKTTVKQIVQKSKKTITFQNIDNKQDRFKNSQDKQYAFIEQSINSKKKNYQKKETISSLKLSFYNKQQKHRPGRKSFQQQWSILDSQSSLKNSILNKNKLQNYGLKIDTQENQAFFNKKSNEKTYQKIFQDQSSNNQLIFFNQQKTKSKVKIQDAVISISDLSQIQQQKNNKKKRRNAFHTHNDKQDDYQPDRQIDQILKKVNQFFRAKFIQNILRKKTSFKRLNQ